MFPARYIYSIRLVALPPALVANNERPFNLYMNKFSLGLKWMEVAFDQKGC